METAVRMADLPPDMIYQSGRAVIGCDSHSLPLCPTRKLRRGPKSTVVCLWFIKSIRVTLLMTPHSAGTCR